MSDDRAKLESILSSLQITLFCSLRQQVFDRYPRLEVAQSYRQTGQLLQRSLGIPGVVALEGATGLLGVIL